MTAPTIHRTRRRTARRGVEFADRYEAGEVMCVSVPECGPGWYVVGVDRGAGLVTVRRDGSEMVVSWADVAE